MRMLRVIPILCLFLLTVFAPSAAHEGREVGEYLISFGWREEPAYAGMMNGPEVFISPHNEDEAFPSDLVVALHAEVSFGDQTTTLNMRQAWQEPGHYIAELVPTMPGDYTFRVFGTIGDVEVDETFSSADGEFSTVEPSTDIMFPAIGSTDTRIAELEARIAELEAAVNALRDE
jgi:hypothetical protein